ncbi:MAG: GNAT family N-acetyltransferase [Halodesulfurarchaeum sp.]
MVEDVTVERATMEDLDRITSLWLELVAGQRSFGSHLRPDENEAPGRDVLGQYIAADGLAVARTEGPLEGPESGSIPAGTIVGFVMWHLDRGLYEEDVERGTIENVYVVPPVRDRGIGSALMARAEDALRGDGAEVVSVSVMAENEDARSFYRGRGYEAHRVTFERTFDDPSP